MGEINDVTRYYDTRLGRHSWLEVCIITMCLHTEMIVVGTLLLRDGTAQALPQGVWMADEDASDSDYDDDSSASSAFEIDGAVPPNVSDDNDDVAAVEYHIETERYSTTLLQRAYAALQGMVEGMEGIGRNH